MIKKELENSIITYNHSKTEDILLYAETGNKINEFHTNISKIISFAYNNEFGKVTLKAYDYANKFDSVSLIIDSNNDLYPAFEVLLKEENKIEVANNSAKLNVYRCDNAFIVVLINQDTKIEANDKYGVFYKEDFGDIEILDFFNELRTIFGINKITTNSKKKQYV